MQFTDDSLRSNEMIPQMNYLMLMQKHNMEYQLQLKQREEEEKNQILLESLKKSIEKNNKSTATKVIGYMLDAYFLINGIIFYIYNNDPESNNGCKNDALLGWTKAAYILIFLQFALQGLERLLRLFNLDLFVKFMSFYGPKKVLISLLVHVILVIGLTIYNDSTCGSLHTVTVWFYALNYLLILISFIGFFFIGLVFAFLSKV